MPTTKLGKCTWGWPEVRGVLAGSFGCASAPNARDTFAQALRTLGYASTPILTSSASVGLRLALEEMQAQRSNKTVVVVPAYCCPSVPRTVRALGLALRAAPVGADLNLDLDATAPLLRDDVLAVVGAHMYALPLDLVRLKKMTDAVGAFLIDDSAHALGPPFGTGGDVGLVSFNQSKTLTGGSPYGGGALFVPNEDLRLGIDRRWSALHEGKSRARAYAWFWLRYGAEITPRALSEYLYDFDIPLMHALGAGDDRAERMSAAAALALCAQVARLNAILTARTAITGWYLDATRRSEGIEFVQTATPRYLSRMFVRWKQDTRARDVRERLARRGFASRMPYPMWTTADDPTAAFIGKVNETHLELPGSPKLVKGDIDELIGALSASLKSA